MHKPWVWILVWLDVGKVVGVLGLTFVGLSLVLVGFNDAEVVNCLRVRERVERERER